MYQRPYYLIILVARDKHQNGAWNLGCRCLPIRDGSTTWQRLPVPAGLEKGGECRDLNHVVSTYAGRIHKKRFIIVFSVWNVIFAIFFPPKVLLSIGQSKYYNFVKQQPRFNCLWNTRLRNWLNYCSADTNEAPSTEGKATPERKKSELDAPNHMCGKACPRAGVWFFQQI